MADQGWRPGLKITALAALVALLASCGHVSRVPPRHTGREGLIDHLMALESASLGLRPSRPLEASGGDDLRFASRHARDWEWPLKNVSVTSLFGRREGGFHEGIDLRARVGTPVHSVEGGEVVYSGNRIGGYGRMVVIRHESGLFSVYAHHSRNLVDEGEKVKRGQKIALSGKSGRASGPHLHFEVRRGARAVDPTEVLPRRQAASKLALFR